MPAPGSSRISWRESPGARPLDADVALVGGGLRRAFRWRFRTLPRRPMEHAGTVRSPTARPGPALCVLEKLAHIEDARLLPDDTVLVRYDVPDDLPVEESPLDGLPESWPADERLTRSIGDAWLDGVSACLLRVPSVIVPIPDADDRNILVNHRHEDAARIAISRDREVRVRPATVRLRVMWFAAWCAGMAASSVTAGVGPHGTAACA